MARSQKFLLQIAMSAAKKITKKKPSKLRKKEIEKKT